jgi:rubredoxin
MFRKNVCLHIFLLHFVDVASRRDLFCGGTSFFNKVKMAAKPSAKNFKCEICDYSTQNQARLKQHTNLVHLNMKNFKCTQCDYSSYKREMLERHSNAVHLEKKEFNVTSVTRLSQQRAASISM